MHTCHTSLLVSMKTLYNNSALLLELLEWRIYSLYLFCTHFEQSGNTCLCACRKLVNSYRQTQRAVFALPKPNWEKSGSVAIIVEWMNSIKFSTFPSLPGGGGYEFLKLIVYHHYIVHNRGLIMRHT